MRTGLVSITFRRLDPARIIELCLNNKLEGIEWGGDVHCPHGDVAVARRVGEMTRSAGLGIPAYGSYYRLGLSEGPNFQDVLKSAEALGTSTIRVWAGTQASDAVTPEERHLIVKDAVRCAGEAGRAGISLALEFHRNTLTDTPASTAKLLEEVNHPNVFTLWQPPHGVETDVAIAGLRQIAPRLRHVHLFHWWPDGSTRLPLEEGRDRWAQFLEAIHSLKPDCDILLEFVRSDDPLQLVRDARALHQLIAQTRAL